MSQASAGMPTFARRGAKVLLTPVVAGAVTLAGHAGPAVAAPLPAAPLPAAPAPAAPVQTAPAVAPAAGPVYLRHGSRGSAVKKVQRKVRVRADGVFGPVTRAAVKRWQRAHRLRATGVVDRTTWRAMRLGAAPKSSARVSGSTVARRALKVAMTRAGMSYRWGAAGPRQFDCSGLTMWAYGKVGKKLPHSSRMQRAMTKRISRPAVGDLVFVHRGGGGRVSHVAFYAGGGKWFDAGSTRRPIMLHKAWYKTGISYGRVR